MSYAYAQRTSLAFAATAANMRDVCVEIAAEADVEIAKLRAILDRPAHSHLVGEHIGGHVDGCLLCDAIFARNVVTAERDELRAEIAALKVRIRELTEWRPMETAPKGRGAILVHCGERKNTYAVCWDSVRETWAVFGGFNVLCEQPTGWLPLPGSEAA